MVRVLTTLAVSRRRMVGGLLGGTVFTSLAVTGPAIAASSKMSKATAGYKNTPNGQNRCERCTQFLPPSACKLVDGAVSPSGWCNLFAAKS